MEIEKLLLDLEASLQTDEIESPSMIDQRMRCNLATVTSVAGNITVLDLVICKDFLLGRHFGSGRVVAIPFSGPATLYWQHRRINTGTEPTRKSDLTLRAWLRESAVSATLQLTRSSSQDLAGALHHVSKRHVTLAELRTNQLMQVSISSILWISFSAAQLE